MNKKITIKEKDNNKEKKSETDIKKLNLNTIKQLYFEHKEIINYIFYGTLAFFVNVITYYLSARMIKIDEVISSGIAWFTAVLFSYLTNKLFVFESKKETFKELFKEMISFFLARVISGICCDVGTFAIMVKVLKINDLISKIITQIMVVIMNYILTKFVVFKNTEEKRMNNKPINKE